MLRAVNAGARGLDKTADASSDRVEASLERQRSSSGGTAEEQAPGIAVFAFNRSEVKNALSRKLVNQLAAGIQQVRHDPDVRTVILKSNAPGVFCAGADLKERKEMTDRENSRQGARKTIQDLCDLPKPVISALDGLALGGGLEIALATDIRVAADTAQMGLVETRLAIIPGGVLGR
ncbi:Methylglutaconyl-CoA hydratase, mitochondrial [Geodia barretti]|uniref:Methylglutaconyl-CoA hydratase, mitochondrial n=1 Tax=Geodia barretti TaxID=519541 RepID=A0AA35SJ42_GEOBA|nr:Methylglutaconyl-CoA hydratase, mitochondrial [Geodia barretti]